MFQFDWASYPRWRRETEECASQNSPLSGSIAGVMALQWQEHCIECAPPLCYQHCPLYVRREDQKCARLVYGTIPNPRFRGLLPYGADLRFRRWGKLEARLTGRYLPVSSLRRLDRADRALTWVLRKTEALLSGIDPQRRLQSAAAWRRERLLQRLGKPGTRFHEFLVECYGFETKPVRLALELRKNLVSAFRTSLEVRQGYNRFSASIPLPAVLNHADEYLLMLYPENDAEPRLVFTILDFVIRKDRHATKASGGTEAESAVASTHPALKVKCVAWDLDNTLWKGILAEDGIDRLQMRPEAAGLIRQLDERGILQTIVSKNHLDDALEALKRFGLEEFFLYPAINWGPKSANLRQIADRLNINIDTFALIDDSIFERSEVAAALPMVRVYAETAVNELLHLPEFDVPLTETSRRRRQSYLTEMQREQAEEVFGDDHIEFLRSCGLRLRLFRPGTQVEIARCHELIQRSNQLNLSSRRYEQAELDELLRDQGMFCLALECQDRFGSYGIVGFASVDRKGENPVAKDFVLSCRVAQKHVEHAFYGWLGSYLKRQGAATLLVQLTKTSKNRPLRRVFEELPFTIIKTEGDVVLLAMDLAGPVHADTVVAVDAASIDARKTGCES